MRRTRAWTEAEEKRMSEAYPKLGPTILAREFERGPNSVFRKAQHMGLKSEGLTPAQQTQIKEMHIGNQRSPEHKREVRNAYGRTFAKTRMDKKRAIKECLRCPQPCLENIQHCEIHWATIIGNCCGHYDNAFGKKILDLLKSQNYKCAMTGTDLIPGVNASLDHIVAISRGGDLDCMDNLQWVTWDVNFGKRQLYVEEYVNLCRKVIDVYDQKFTQLTLQRNPVIPSRPA